jgi:anti-anti-sigma factor
MINLKAMFTQVEEIIHNKKFTLLFDLTDCDYINSSMISLFVYASTKVQDQGGWVKLIVPQPNSREILELVGIDKITGLYNSEKEFTESIQ